MKPFRGTLIAAALLAVVAVLWFVLKPADVEGADGGPRVSERPAERVGFGDVLGGEEPARVLGLQAARQGNVGE